MNIWLWISGAIAAMIAFCRKTIVQILFSQTRFRDQDGSILYDLVIEKGKEFLLYKEEGSKNQLPREYRGLCYLKRMIFSISITERMLRAGFSGTDSVFTCTCLRWHRKKILRLIEESRINDESVNVYLAGQWGPSRIGSLKTNVRLTDPYMQDKEFDDLDSDISDVIDGRRDKVGALLHGPPGNGKSYLARYFAVKYKMPIYIVTFSPDSTNHSIIQTFGNITGPAIILLEDFDGYFDGRENKLENAKFTFDAVLNVLDGTFCTYSKTVFFMTTNHFDKIDGAITRRPSRMKHVIMMDDPNDTIRMKILNDDQLVEESQGMSLDEVLMFAEKNTQKA